MISEAYRDLLARHLAVESDHRMPETLATLTDDCVFDDRGLGRVFHGRAGAKEHYELWWDAFEVVPHTELRHYPDPALCIVETVFRGRHVGEFLSVSPTGREIAVPVAIFIDLRDGLLAGERFYWDLATLLRQLDVDALPNVLLRKVVLNV